MRKSRIYVAAALLAGLPCFCEATYGINDIINHCTEVCKKDIQHVAPLPQADQEACMKNCVHDLCSARDINIPAAYK